MSAAATISSPKPAFASCKLAATPSMRGAATCGRRTEEDHFSMGARCHFLFKMAGQTVQVVAGVGGAHEATVSSFAIGRLESGRRRIATRHPGARLLARPRGMLDGLSSRSKNSARCLSPRRPTALECADGFPYRCLAQPCIGRSLLRLWPLPSPFFSRRPLPERGEIFRQPRSAKICASSSSRAQERGSRTAKIQAVRDYSIADPLQTLVNFGSHGGLET